MLHGHCICCLIVGWALYLLLDCWMGTVCYCSIAAVLCIVACATIWLWLAYGCGLEDSTEPVVMAAVLLAAELSVKYPLQKSLDVASQVSHSCLSQLPHSCLPLTACLPLNYPLSYYAFASKRIAASLSLCCTPVLSGLPPSQYASASVQTYCYPLCTCVERSFRCLL